jgi:hypothetical protein
MRYMILPLTEDSFREQDRDKRIDKMFQSYPVFTESAQRMPERFLDYEKMRNIMGKRIDIAVFQDPTGSELKDIIQNDQMAQWDEGKRARGILTLKGKLYVGMCEDGEFLHDDLLFTLDKMGKAIHQSGWEREEESDILAVRVSKSKVIEPSSDSYRYGFPENIEDFRPPKGYTLSIFTDELNDTMLDGDKNLWGVQR